MENNLIIISSKSRPPLSVPSYSATHFECHNSTRFHANSNNISMNKRLHPKLIDAQLNQLCVNGPLSEAVAILDSLGEQGSTVRPITYMNLLQSCIDRDCIWVGRELHARIGLVRKVNPFVETKLISMYAKCGQLEDARKVFDEMRERNLFTWSAMIGACSRDQSWEEVVDLFYAMMQDGFLPDDFLLPKILQACAKCWDFETGRLIHSLVIRSGMHSAMHVNNSVLSVYAKCGEMSCAKKLFNCMDERSSVTWNAIITGYCQKGEIEQAQKYFDAMQEEGIEPGLVIWNILIASYNQLGYCDIAMDLMRKMESFGITPDVYTWTSMISGLTHKGMTIQAFDLLREMFLAGVEPNNITIASATSACASLKSLNMGLEIHCIAVKLGLVDDVLIGNSLIDMYSKGGNLEAAQHIFDMMLERDVYSWNSIIGGYIQAGFCGKAHELFMKMQVSDSPPPNVVTWNVMITAYMQNGDVDQAMDLFQRIEKDGKIKRNVASWNSLISGFLQSGQKDKALQIFRQMQFSHITPNSITMLSILHACANLVAGKKVKEIHCCAVRRNLVSELSVSNIFIDSYAKSGNIMYSRNIFGGLSSKDIISWNSLLAGYVLHGCSESALDLFYQMRKEGLQLSRGTFVNVILAYSQAGMVEEGKRVFSSLSEEYHIRPGLDHYFAMVYLLGRSGKLAEALEFIQNLPIEPNSSVWAALLTACRIHRNFRLAILAAERLLELEPGNNITQHVLSQAYSLCGMSWDAPNMTKLEKEMAVKKPVGQCWIERKNMVHTFVVGDQSKPYSDKLHSWLKRVAENVKADISDNGLCIEEEEKENNSSVHSEKLAFAFALTDSHDAPQILRIVKNLRMCRDCHDTAKYISSAYGCEIYLSDSNCLHHFKGGHCSCRDYW
ncbi:pentatricopeptide repeat-containing protein At1g19720 [Gastrolobium bilobum]|uniref:pentatricopeptide repeat-containing protein At1g19720 n=1 Tax=Gastrolobium bilobum TaxID=150636 RepID=UPI002AB1AB5D|nr:pentatricopeptide repeat-containing protein At1g19720 [Gastrolobium bilobum]